ncbi:MAG: Fe-S cluster assembly protein SufD [Arenicella sp.]
MTAAVKQNKTQPLLLPSEAGISLPGAGQEWLDSLRNNASKQFSVNGLPTVRDEEWRYTDIRKLKRLQFSMQFSAPDVRECLNNLPDYNLTRIVLVNGLFSPEMSTVRLSDDEKALITISSLAKKLEDDSLQGLLGSTLPADRHAFVDLNTAYCFDGVVIEVAAKAKLEKPIEIIHVTTTHSAQASVTHPRNLIIAGKLSESQFIERSIAMEGEERNIYLNNTVTEIIAHDGSKLDHYKVQEESKTAFHFGGVFISQSRDAHVVNHNIALGGVLVRNDIYLNLLGTGAHGGMNGLVLGHDSQHVHNHTEVAHRLPHCTSDEFYKTVLDDKSRAVFRGRIIVAQDAQKTNAEQQNNNLLLSNDAEADTKPQLEIYADDVICSHGATIGQLDEKSLFYFQSRGIKKDDARRLLTFAFVNEVVDRITFEPLRNELTQRFLGELLPSTPNNDGANNGENAEEVFV